MSQYCCEIDNTHRMFDGGSLHGSDLMLVQRLAHDVEPVRQRRIVEMSSARSIA
jgi:hypothetical protein